jgi:hypothetical protein
MASTEETHGEEFTITPAMTGFEMVEKALVAKGIGLLKLRVDDTGDYVTLRALMASDGTEAELSDDVRRAILFIINTQKNAPKI